VERIGQHGDRLTVQYDAIGDTKAVIIRVALMSPSPKLPRLLLTSLLILGAIAMPMSATAPQDTDPERGFTQTVQPFLDTYCTTCHGGAKPASSQD
jgi:hypothetical protein